MVSVAFGEFPEAIVRIARPIHGEDELDQLLDLIGHARIVLLGEGSHGTHEFYDLRASLTRKLIGERGFAAIAIEGDWPDALRVDRYIRRLGDDDSADAALSSFERFPTWMWRNEESEDLVEWLHRHNRHRAPEQRAGFYGLDLYSLHASSRSVLSFLRDHDPEAAERARDRYACFDHAGADPLHDGLLALDCEDEIVEQLVELQRRRTARSGRSPRGDAWFNAILSARVVEDAEAYYRMMFRGRTVSWNLRDTHMANTLDMLAAHLGAPGHPAKLVVWAHNSHVGDARATAIGAEGRRSLGQLMRQRHPDKVALVGFSTHAGTVACAHDWDEPVAIERVRPSLPDSWEGLFHASGLPRFMVTSSALRRVVGERVARLHRAIGVVYRPETERHSHYYEARIAEQYDLVVHLDTTRAVVPLDREEPAVAAGAAAGVPATSPTGF